MNNNINIGIGIDISRSCLLLVMLLFSQSLAIQSFGQGRAIANSSFEVPAIPSPTLADSSFIHFYEAANSTGTPEITGWQTTDGPATLSMPGHPQDGQSFISPIEIWDGSVGPVAAAEGNQFIELNAFSDARLYFDICVVGGETISWTYYHRGRESNSVPDIMDLCIYDATGTTKLLTLERASDLNTAWAKYDNSAALALPPGDYQLAFESVSTSSGSFAKGNFIDAIDISLDALVEFENTSYSALEGDTTNLPNLLINGTVPSGGGTVTVSVTSSTATAADYTLTTTIVVPAGEYSPADPFPVPITIINDGDWEPTEDINIVINSATNLSVGPTDCVGAAEIQTVYNITNDDEHCSNGIDDDGDGLVDCKDPDCNTNVSCPDNDLDGINDEIDVDDDNDGLSDAFENSLANGDSDFAGNSIDLDSDNDGISDVIEAGFMDINFDGFVDEYDPVTKTFAVAADTNMDGMADAYTVLTAINSDTDVDYDFLDLDSDNDNVSDLAESGLDPTALDTDNNSQIDATADVDLDGIDDSIDGNTSEIGFLATNPQNTDSDTERDYIDQDDDNDGVYTVHEGVDPDGDKNPATGATLNTDGDLLLNYLDVDDDNDGVNTIHEGSNPDLDGDPSTGATQNTDGDLLSDYLDTDDDGDNVATLYEGTNTDGDGDPTTGATQNTDGDLVFDYLDMDDDNDLVLTIHEGVDPDGDQNPTTGTTLNTDNDSDFNYLDEDDDNDGVYTQYEGVDPDNDQDPTTGATLNTDGDAAPNYLDEDDDNDLVNTVHEGVNVDADGNPNTGVTTNSDTDLIPNYLDADDDNDGVLTQYEGVDDDNDQNPNTGSTLNTDGDSFLNYLDADDDNDGVRTEFEGVDPDNDQNPNTGLTLNTDGDAINNYLDIDDDGDGVNTSFENTDDDFDGNPSTGITIDTDDDLIFDYLDVDDDGDLVNTLYEGVNPDNDGNPSTGATQNTDNDGIPDYLDQDDDEDGILTKDEGADPDNDQNPNTGLTLDADGDLVWDYLDDEDNRALCSPFPSDSTETFNSKLCIAIPGEFIADFNIYVDNGLYTGALAGCDLTQVADYNLSNSLGASFDACNDFSLVSWTFNGNTVGPFDFTSFDALATWMNLQDPTGGWSFDNGTRLLGGDETGTYGDLQIISNCNLGTAQIKYNIDINPQGVQIDLGDITCAWVKVESKTDPLCTDSTYVCVEGCNFLPDDQPLCVEANSGSVAGTGGLCAAIAPTDVADYIILVDGQTYTGPLTGCNNTRVADYNIFNSTNASFRACDDFELRSWMVDGIEQGPLDFVDFVTLTNWMNTVDPAGAWVYDGTTSISGGTATATYGDLDILSRCNLGTALVGYNVDIVPQSVLLDLTEDCQWVSIQHVSDTTCIDSVFVCVDCQAPVAVDDEDITEINDNVNVECLDNDSDPKDLTIEVCNILVAPQNGTAVINADFSIDYNPATDYVGQDSLQYELCNETGQTASAWVVITITPPCAEIFADAEVTISGESCDPISGPDVSFCIPISGNSFSAYTFEVNGTTYTGPFTGCNEVLVSDYNLANSLGASFQSCNDYELNSWTVNGVTQGTLSFATFIELTTWMNTQDPTGNWSFDGTESIAGGNPTTSYGDLVIKSNCNLGLATVGYNTDIVPQGVVINLPKGQDSWVKVSDNVNPNCVDSVLVKVDCPQSSLEAIDDNFTGDINKTLIENILTNDLNPDGLVLTVNSTPVTNPSNGTVGLNSDGTLTYIPNQDFEGRDSLQYAVCDPNMYCDTAWVFIDIIDMPNNAPVAQDDIFNTLEDQPLMGSVIPNDSDPDGDNITVSPVLLVSPTNGSVTINTDGTFTYTPNENYNGTDTFRYQLCDDATPALCDSADVVINIEPVVDAPISEDASLTIDQNVALEGNLNDYVSDPDNGVLNINTNPTVLPQNGTVVINPDGSFVYTPNTGFVGTDTFEFEVCNDNLVPACVRDVISINVLPLEDLTVYQGFSPNGDNENDIWTIDGIENYSSNTVKIFNRWGNLVWENQGYNNGSISWAGNSNAGELSLGIGTDQLPDGTYFYVIELNNEDNEIRKGFVVIHR